MQGGIAVEAAGASTGHEISFLYLRLQNSLTALAGAPNNVF
jgi:hypothetical protein